MMEMDKTSIFNIKTGHFVQKHPFLPKKFSKIKSLKYFQKKKNRFFENENSEKSLKSLFF